MRSALLALALLAVPAAGGDPVRRLALPDGSAGPEVVAVGATVHVVYGREKDAWYQRSDDGGKTFAAPLRVNDTPGDVFAAMERGPRVAVGGDGTVHVVWSPEKLLGARHARLLPGKKAFEPAKDLRQPGAEAAEGLVVAARGEDVLAVWLDGKSGAPKNSPVGLPLWGAWSEDDGATWSKAAPLAHDYGGGACACCHLAASADATGHFVVAFRGAKDGVRDLFALWESGERSFRAIRLTQDEWKLQGCPMDGARLAWEPARDASGFRALLVAHTVDGKVGWTSLERGHVDVAGPMRPGAKRGKFALALPAPSGVVLVWLDGDRWRWRQGEREGTLDLPAATRAAAFVDGDGVVVVVG